MTSAPPSPMPGLALLQDDLLTRGVLLRRVCAWLLDLAIVASLIGALSAVISFLGLLTLGFGWGLFAVLPIVPFLYGWLTLASPLQASPGQALFGLIVVRNDDLGRPTLGAALVSTLGYIITLYAGVLWVGVALLTARRRTLHDLVARLAVIRRRALDAPLASGASAWNASPSTGSFRRP